LPEEVSDAHLESRRERDHGRSTVDALAPGRIYKTDVYEGQRGNTYWVRWQVAGKRWKEPFKTSALAESFRSDLVSASRKGEAFDVETGRPVSMTRKAPEMSWYNFACKFVDMKWPHIAATTRRTPAEAMTALTVLMLKEARGRPDEKLIRRALSRWAFNTVKRDEADRPEDVTTALHWLERNTRPVATLAKPEVLRSVLDGLTVKLDGTPAAPSVLSRRRKIFNTAIEYAVELSLLGSNPMPALKWKAPKPVLVVDRRSVPNPVQARTLLYAVRDSGRNGRRLVAFFGCLYFAAMRPEEAVALNKRHLALPAKGWVSSTSTALSPTPARNGPTAARIATAANSSNANAARSEPCPARLN
jgi:hypothetical protein